MDPYVMAVRIAESPTGLYLEPEPQIKSPSKNRMWQKLGLSKFFARDGHAERDEFSVPQWSADTPQGLRRNWSRKVGVGLPRPATFKRQNSERREHLEPVNPSHGEKRALSQNRQRTLSLGRPRARSSPPPFPCPRISAPAVTHSNDFPELSHANTAPSHSEEPEAPPEGADGLNGEVRKAPSQTFSEELPPSSYGDEERDQLNAELDSRWILNLSMHFRDKSDREKFFITFAQEPTLWRRVTVSCDYRRAEPDSLEMDLKELQFQRDKSAQIYESIRDSLPDIQFYDTVTNLKLETTDGRLHVHVTEDVNEIIPYPPISSVSHLTDAKLIRESEIAFDSHLSGFVYRVNYRNRDFIKKEIPGPDTVDEFLYETNALYSIRDSQSVVDFKGIIVDDKRKVVKGVLIDFAEQGALVDLIYDHKGKLELSRRLRWAKQVVQGLAEIHEAGFVQGDLTLSNVVIDKDDNAKIIDINRRGCPVGWEPPEIAAKIASNQRISMYIGVKSDLYQLGMTLWGIAAQEDEPERCDRPLDVDGPLSGVPPWYREIVQICLSERPQDRLSAKELEKLFLVEQYTTPRHHYNPTISAPGKPKKYIEPSAAVEREDLERFGSISPHQRSYSTVDHQSTGETLIPAPSTTYRCDSPSSTFGGLKHGHYDQLHSYDDFEDRGRRRSREDDIEVLLKEEDDANSGAHIVSISPDDQDRHAEIDLDGSSYIIDKSSFNPEDLQVLVDKIPKTPEQSQLTTQSSAGMVDDTKAHTEISPDSLDRAESGSSKTPTSTPQYTPAAIVACSGRAPLSLSMTGDLIGCGVNPTLEKYSPDEPKITNHLSLHVPQAEDFKAKTQMFSEPELILNSKPVAEGDFSSTSEQPHTTPPHVSLRKSTPPSEKTLHSSVKHKDQLVDLGPPNGGTGKSRQHGHREGVLRSATDTFPKTAQSTPSGAHSSSADPALLDTSETHLPHTDQPSEVQDASALDISPHSTISHSVIRNDTLNPSRAVPNLRTPNSDFDPASETLRQH